MKTATIEYPGADQVFLAKVGVLATAAGETRCLGDLFDIASGAYVADYVSKESRGAVPYLRVDNVRPYVPNLTDADVEWVSAPAGAELKRISAAAGDVVIARTGTLGKAFVADVTIEGAVLSQHLTKLTMKAGTQISPHGLAAYLNSSTGSAALEALATGSTRLELTHSALASLPLPLNIADDSDLLVTASTIPSLFAEMRTEAESAIRLVDELLGPASPATGFETFIEHLDSAAIERSLVPRFWSPEAVALEQRLVDAFECRPLGAIADVFRGSGTLSLDYEREGIPYARTSSLVNYGIDFLPDHYGSESLYRSQGQLVREGDILLSMEGRVGMTALLAPGERCLVKNHIEIIRPSEQTSWISPYLFAVLSSPVGQAQLRRRTVVQATIPGLGSASREVLIPLAPRDSDGQDRFSAVIADVCAHVHRSLRARTNLAAQIHRVESLMRKTLDS